jgi:hypothetical protein
MAGRKLFMPRTAHFDCTYDQPGLGIKARETMQRWAAVAPETTSPVPSLRQATSATSLLSVTLRHVPAQG